MADQKHFRMDDIAARLDNMVREWRIIQERQAKLIEELASLATAALGWSWLAEANGLEVRRSGKEEKQDEG